MQLAKDIKASASASASASSSITYVKDRLFNDVRYWVDDTLLRTLGWLPRISFETGLRDTVQWYKDRLHVLADIWPHYASAVGALDDTPTPTPPGNSA